MPAPEGYIDVAERLVEFRTRYPDGSLQQVDLQFLDFAGKTWVVYTAGAYRTPDDLRPGHGTAWEPVPGPTSFTRDSELQNAETSAWGRAIVAVLAADTKRGVASADEVRNRQAPPDRPAVEVDMGPVEAAIAEAEAVGAKVNADIAREQAAQSPEWADHVVGKVTERIQEATS